MVRNIANTTTQSRAPRTRHARPVDTRQCAVATRVRVHRHGNRDRARSHGTKRDTHTVDTSRHRSRHGTAASHRRPLSRVSQASPISRRNGGHGAAAPQSHTRARGCRPATHRRRAVPRGRRHKRTAHTHRTAARAHDTSGTAGECRHAPPPAHSPGITHRVPRHHRCHHPSDTPSVHAHAHSPRLSGRACRPRHLASSPASHLHGRLAIAHPTHHWHT